MYKYILKLSFASLQEVIVEGNVNRRVQAGHEVMFSPPRTWRENLVISINNQEEDSRVIEYSSQRENSNSAAKPRRPFRNPAWFIDLDVVCFKCKRRCSPGNIVEHFNHASGGIEYFEAPLLRDSHLTRWAELFHQVVLVIMRKLRIHSRKGMIDYLHKFTDKVPRKLSWSNVHRHAFNRYFQIYGGIIRPEFLTLNPPNSTLVLAHRVIFDRLLQHHPEVNSAIYKALKKL